MKQQPVILRPQAEGSPEGPSSREVLRSAQDDKKRSRVRADLRGIYIIWYRDVLRFWRDRARVASALGQPIDLSRQQYEALHDGNEPAGLDYRPRREFTIARVGTTYQSAFQDLGVEYYEYAL